MPASPNHAADDGGGGEAEALEELRDEVDESGLALALERIFASQPEGGYYGFNNSI